MLIGFLSWQVNLEHLFPYMLIGFLSGVIGICTVNLNARWMAIRKRHAKAWVLRHRFAWSTLLVLTWGLISVPDGPFGSFMAKGQILAISELFQVNRI